MRAIFYLYVEFFFENELREGSNPEWTTSLCIFVVPALWNSSDKNGVIDLQNSYPDVIMSRFKSFVRATHVVYLQGSASFL